MIVQRADERDHAAIAEIVGTARASGEPWALRWTESAVLAELSVAHAWVLRSHGPGSSSVQGFLLAREPGTAWELMLVALRPEARGRGWFAQLLAALRGMTAAAPIRYPIWLEVRVDNRAAMRAYEKAGFRVSGTRRRYYSDGMDAGLMELGATGT